MFQTSNEHVFARIGQLHRCAQRLVYGDQGQPTAEPAAPLVEEEAAALAARVDLRVVQLATQLELDALAVDVLLCTLLADCDPFSRLLLRAQQREVGRPWIELGTVAQLLDLPLDRMPELRRALSPQAPLRRWALVEVDDGERGVPLVATRLKIATRVAQHLTGDDELPGGMSLRVARLVVPEDPPQVAPAPRAAGPAPSLIARVERAIELGDPILIEVIGRPFTGRHAYAEALCDRLGLPLFTLDLAHEDPQPIAFRLGEARRDARLAGAVLCLRHLDALLPSVAAPAGSEGPPPATAPRLPPAVARFLEESTEVVLTTSEDGNPALSLHAPSIVQVTIPFPPPSERARLLEAALAARELAPAPDVDLVSIARRFALDPRRIEIAARAASELARERDPDTETFSHGDVVSACRRQVRHDLQSLASRVVTSHRWEDLVIPVDVYDGLLEMTEYVRHAHQVYDQWGFAARHSLSEGVSALFAGPPGTGKTMCASVIARELDMELFRVDLSRVVSKWIGETEKNLSKVFDEAQHSNAIILFDEADSLFAKRTEVKSSVDRYANLEVNYLLQRMEAFGGVTILTTNFEDTIDTAFKRRLTFRLRFEKPDAEARAALWRKVFPPACRMAADFDPEALGRWFEISGGSIRNAAVRAAFYAAAAGPSSGIDQATCMKAAEREAREMGQLTRMPPPPPAPPTPEEERARTEAERPRPSGNRPAKFVPITRRRKE